MFLLIDVGDPESPTQVRELSDDHLEDALNGDVVVIKALDDGSFEQLDPTTGLFNKVET